MNTRESEIHADPSTSRWLKSSIEALESRDIVDMLNDIDILQQLAQQRYQSITDVEQRVK